MIYLKRSLIFVLCIFLICTFFGCDFDESRSNFVGGELLDEEKLSEIKNSILTEESKSVQTENETQTQGQESIEDNIESEPLSNITESVKDEITDTEFSEMPDTELSEMPTNDITETWLENESQVVYWTEGGTVWHLTPDCYRLNRSKNVLSGTIDDAKEAGKERLCSSCGK